MKILRGFDSASGPDGRATLKSASLSIGSGPEQACGLSVVNGKDSTQSTMPFTYTLSQTPLIVEISPRRGSTAGGTRLTVTGSGFRYRLHTGAHKHASRREPVFYPETHSNQGQSQSVDFSVSKSCLRHKTAPNSLHSLNTYSVLGTFLPAEGSFSSI